MPSEHIIEGVSYPTDSKTNVSPKIISLMNRKLHLKDRHPLNFIQKRIADFMYSRYRGPRGPLFSLHDGLSPVVTLKANFDSLLVPEDHVSRKTSDSYYLNSTHMLRAHTSAHQTELIGMGLDNFLVSGDVYRRDAVDRTHFPVFHQLEGVRLVDNHELTRMAGLHSTGPTVRLFENQWAERTPQKQAVHAQEAVDLLEKDLKDCLLGLTRHLFGNDIEYRWVDCYFPFTHPSWELEVVHEGQWLEVLGCGIIEQEILAGSAAGDKVGFAFGLGLERLAMRLYQIPDIRLFWSQDSGFTSQFNTDDHNKHIVYKEISRSPQCINDMSFWLPTSSPELPAEGYSENDFYDLVRSVGGDLIEQVEMIDEFQKKGRTSHCYRIVYRHMHRTLTQDEVNTVHKRIEAEAASQLGVELR